MKVRYVRALALTVAGLGAAPLADATDKHKAESAKAQVQPAAVAAVGAARISVAEFEEKAAARLLTLRSQEYEVKRQVLDDMIADLLLKQEAAARGLSPEDLLSQEVDAKTPPVQDAESKAMYDQVKNRFPNKPEADLMGEIQAHLRNQKLQGRRADLVKELRGKAAVKVFLDPPRVAVEPGDAPMKGAKTAPITIVEFSDFQCPYCGRVAPTLKQIEGRYGASLRLFFRDYPLPMHPQAPKAAEAGQCAKDQGRFWEMHDRLFADQSKLQVADLKQHAADIGLNAEQFDECLDSGRHAADWQRNLDEGSRYGVSGTPAFFINGRFVSGAQPYEAFARVVEEELQRAGIAVPAAPPPPPVSAPTADSKKPEPPTQDR